MASQSSEKLNLQYFHPHRLAGLTICNVLLYALLLYKTSMADGFSLQYAAVDLIVLDSVLYEL